MQLQSHRDRIASACSHFDEVQTVKVCHGPLYTEMSVTRLKGWDRPIVNLLIVLYKLAYLINTWMQALLRQHLS